MIDTLGRYKIWESKLQGEESAWLAEMRADKERVLNAIRAGRDAALLKDWVAETERRPTALTVPSGGDEDSFDGMAEERFSLSWGYRWAEARRASKEVEEAPAKFAAEAAAEAARKRLAGRIDLADEAGAAGVVFGTDVATGVDFIVPVKKLQHMLVAGVPGSGKSVLLHAIVTALVRSAEVERLVLVDLKGGLEFERYRDSGKAEVVWTFPDVVRIVDGLMRLAEARQDSMRQNRQQLWPNGRTVLVIDEFAEVQTSIDTASEREEKATAKRLAANLLSLARRARALGILLVFALQKATVDAMDSSLRNNLACRLVLRQANRLTAQSLLESEELDQLPVWPMELPDGRFYYSEPSRGELRLLQAHVAPGIELE